jgi:RNA recognition motif-containing protein
MKPVKKAPAKPASKPTSRKQSKVKESSDEESSDESEDEKPKKAVRKQSNVSQKSAGKKAAAKKAVESDEDEEEEENKGGEEGPSELFVGNMAFSTDENALRKQFSKYGQITNIKVLMNPQGKSKGCAFVAFASASSAQKALDGENGNSLEGRELKVNFSSGGGNKGGDQQRSFSQGPRGGQSGGDGESTTIFVGNLGFKTQQHTL